MVFKDKSSEQPLRKQPSSKKLAAAAKASNTNMQQALERQPKEEEDEEEEEEEEEEETETETESSSEEENTEAIQERRMLRELKLLSTKLKSFKEKEEAARKERRSLRDQLKKQQQVRTIESPCLWLDGTDETTTDIRIMSNGICLGLRHLLGSFQDLKTPTGFLPRP